jgi:hypothetical protein
MEPSNGVRVLGSSIASSSSWMPLDCSGITAATHACENSDVFDTRVMGQRLPELPCKLYMHLMSHHRALLQGCCLLQSYMQAHMIRPHVLLASAVWNVGARAAISSCQTYIAATAALAETVRDSGCDKLAHSIVGCCAALCCAEADCLMVPPNPQVMGKARCLLV